MIAERDQLAIRFSGSTQWKLHAESYYDQFIYVDDNLDSIRYQYRHRNPKTLLDCGKFDELYATSIKDPDFFWGTLAKQFLQWDKPFEKVMDCSMEKGEVRWFTDGKINVSGIKLCTVHIDMGTYN